MNSKLLLDTNILIDFMMATRPEHEYARELFSQIGTGTIEGYVSSGSLKDVYYISRKVATDQESRNYLKTLSSILTFLPVRSMDIMQALVSNEPDFEDGIIRAVAENNNIDFIITRDKGAFQHSPVRSMSAKKYLELFTYPER